MGYRRYIPQELLDKHPQFTRDEIRSMLNVVWKSIHNIMRQSDVFEIRIKGIGTVKSHGNKKLKYIKKIKKRDVKRKREKYRKDSFRDDKLLF